MNSGFGHYSFAAVLKHLAMQEEDKSETKGHFADADKIEYSHRGPTVAPKHNRGYTISITPDELVVTIKAIVKFCLQRSGHLHERNLIS